jgi:hypothetical protein
MKTSFRLILLGSVGLSACGGATDPTGTQLPHVAGQFQLIEYDGKALPTELRVLVGVSAIAGDTRYFNCPEMLTAATLQLGGDSSLSRTTHLSYPCTGTLPHPTVPDSVRQAETGSYRTTGDSLTFTFHEASGATITEYAHLVAGDFVFFRLDQGFGVTSSTTLTHRVYRAQ